MGTGSQPSRKIIRAELIRLRSACARAAPRRGRGSYGDTGHMIRCFKAFLTF